ncbi:hypothetical protein JCM15060_07700 [Halanaerobaculum tunisiense]
MQAVKSSFYQAAGSQLEKIISVLTTNTITGILTGILVTILIQSSSATTVIIISLVNANLISFQGAVGVVMGANIGTTITVQLLSFNLDSYISWLLMLGLILYIFYWLTNYSKLCYVARGLLGFSLVWWGLDLLSNLLVRWQNVEWFVSLLAHLANNPVWGLLVGGLITALIQSSSAVNGVVVAIARVNLINLPAAISLALGSNVGTCITAFLAAWDASQMAKEIAKVHLLFNITGVIIFLPLLPLFSSLISLTSEELVRQIANAHTIFNLLNTVVVLSIRQHFFSLITDYKV